MTLGDHRASGKPVHRGRWSWAFMRRDTYDGPGRKWTRNRLAACHRITGVQPGTVTLVLVGPKVRTWGFYVDGRFVDWRDACGIRPTEGARSTGKYREPSR